jgi:hypothetical protein
MHTAARVFLSPPQLLARHSPSTTTRRACRPHLLAQRQTTMAQVRNAVPYPSLHPAKEQRCDEDQLEEHTHWGMVKEGHTRSGDVVVPPVFIRLKLFSTSTYANVHSACACKRWFLNLREPSPPFREPKP